MTDEKEEMALDALIVMALTEYMDEPSQEEIDEFMNDDMPLTDDEREMLDKVGDELPWRIREWEAARKGCLVVSDER